MAKYKFIYCEWVDATSDGLWSKPEELGLDSCAAAGFLVKETKDFITIAATYHDDQVNAFISIPKGWIKKRKTIKI